MHFLLGSDGSADAGVITECNAVYTCNGFDTLDPLPTMVSKITEMHIDTLVNGGGFLYTGPVGSS